jgi:hypothetical protein
MEVWCAGLKLIIINRALNLSEYPNLRQPAKFECARMLCGLRGKRGSRRFEVERVPRGRPRDRNIKLQHYVRGVHVSVYCCVTCRAVGGLRTTKQVLRPQIQTESGCEEGDNVTPSDNIATGIQNSSDPRDEDKAQGL